MERVKPNLEEQEGRFEKAFEKTFDKMQVLKVEYMTTRECELSCDYCKIIDKKTLRGREQTTEEVFQSIDIIADNWPGAPIIWFGGEPTTRDDLPEIIGHCRDRDVKYAVISNSLRVLRDTEYRERLVANGLSNWSGSLDDLVSDGTVDKHTLVKSNQGLKAMMMFRDAYGVRDLVVCMTITKHNIERMPAILEMLTKEGIWGICTPLQIGGPEYEYSKGNFEDLPSQEQIEKVAPILQKMAESGRYLMHNDPGWFEVWPEHFRKQDWICNDKGLLTVDADGKLKYCVDIDFRDGDAMNVLELATEEGRQRYLKAITKGPPCTGCLWDPAYEAIMRARNPGIGVEEGRKRYRHEIDAERSRQLLPEARKWFIENRYLQPTHPTHDPATYLAKQRGRSLPVIHQIP